MKIAVTGCEGFVGQALLNRLREDPYTLVGIVRRPASDPLPMVSYRVHADFCEPGGWPETFDGVDVVVHAAARVHALRDTVLDPLGEFRRVNVAATCNLARQAHSAGVRRFVFISSIKVNGEHSEPGCPYSADAVAAPVDAYGISKHEAEMGLRDIAASTGLEVVIIRPVLIYGPGVKANFLRMMKWLHRGTPWPLACARNQRSLVYIDNLVDLIAVCLHHPAAANQTFLVSDGEDLSTPELLRRLGCFLGVKTHLLPVPVPLLRFVAAVAGKEQFIQRLCGSLQVDIGKTRRLLGWTPPATVDEGLRCTALQYLEQRRCSRT